MNASRKRNSSSMVEERNKRLLLHPFVSERNNTTTTTTATTPQPYMPTRRKRRRRVTQERILRTCLLTVSLFCVLTVRTIYYHSSAATTTTANNNNVLTEHQPRQPVQQQRQTLQQQRYAWLMSFPNSGTSFTSRLVRDFSHTYTATNYAAELEHPETMLLDTGTHSQPPHGPYWVKQDHYTPPPTKSYLLIKTHCGLRCAHCPPEQYHETTFTFRYRCGKTVSNQPHGLGHFDSVQKAVHLFRNPFSNVVSRFHLERTRPDRTAQHYPDTKLGFLEYCLGIDSDYTQSEIAFAGFDQHKVLQQLWLVPCHADFVRYVEWHNLAFYVSHDKQVPSLTVRYEDYGTQLVKMAQQLSDFLELPMVGALPRFELKEYHHYYSAEEKRIVKEAFEFMASRETWDVVKDYF